MTTRDMVVQAWELAGEPSDLDPYQANAPSPDTAYLDADSTGVAHYLREISDVQLLLANWKTRRGRPIRFKKFYRQRNVKLGRTDSMDCTLPDPSMLHIPAPPVWVNPDYMDTCRVDVEWEGVIDDGETTPYTDSQSYTVACMVAEWDGTAIDMYLMEDLELPDNVSATTSMTCQIYFDRFSVVQGTGMGDYVTVTLPETFRNIMRLSTSSDGTMVPQAAYREDLMNPTLTDGTPAEWYTQGNRVFFDVYLITPTWFTIEYQSVPQTITDLDQDIDIPQEWHTVLLLMLEWKEAKRNQDVEKEMALKSALTSTIEQLRPDAEEEFLRETTRGFYVKREDR